MTETNQNQKLEELLHAINHDLRTPLSNMRSVATILSQDSSLSFSENQRAFLQIMEKSILRLLDQSNRLLMFGEVAFGQQQPDRIHLSDLLANADKTLKNSYEIEETSFISRDNPVISCHGLALSALLALLAAGDTKQESNSAHPASPTIKTIITGSQVQFTIHSQMTHRELDDNFITLADEIVRLHGGILETTEENGRKKFTFSVPTASPED